MKHIYKHTFANGFEVSCVSEKTELGIITYVTPFEIPEECMEEYERWRKEYVNPDILSHLPDDQAEELRESGFEDAL